MTWPADTATRPPRHDSGFTLIEMMVVLAVLGLMLALLAEGGPPVSRALVAKQAASELATALREARSRAIAENRSVDLTFDLPARTYRVDDLPARRLPAEFRISLLTATEEVRSTHSAGIRFDPDGSSTGGRIELLDNKRAMRISVDWLTGRVSVGDAR